MRAALGRCKNPACKFAHVCQCLCLTAGHVGKRTRPQSSTQPSIDYRSAAPLSVSSSASSPRSPSPEPSAPERVPVPVPADSSRTLLPPAEVSQPLSSPCSCAADTLHAPLRPSCPTSSSATDAAAPMMVEHTPIPAPLHRSRHSAPAYGVSLCRANLPCLRLSS